MTNNSQQEVPKLPPTKSRLISVKRATILALIVLGVAAAVLSSQWWQRSSAATQNMRTQVQELEKKVEELKKVIEQQKLYQK